MDKNSSINTTPIIKNDEIDLVALIKTIWNGRKTVYYSVGVCVFVGLLIAFLSPEKYAASATLLPSTEKKSSSLGGLGALAGMAGVNLGSMLGQSEGIPAELYPQVVNSYPFINEFIHEKFNFKEYEQPISIYDYVVADTIPTLGAQIFKYTIKLPWTLKDAVFPDNEVELGENLDLGVLYLAKEELLALEYVSEMFQIGVDESTGLVSIELEAEEPILAAQYVQKGVDILQKYIIDYKTQQVRKNLEFIQGRFDAKKKEYEEAQKSYFNYKDRHRNIISERIDPEFQRLSDAYEIASIVYKDLAQQLEASKIAVKEETPVFTVLEPPKVPDEKSGPKRKIIVVLSLFLGCFIGLLGIYGKILWINYGSKF